MTPPGDHPQEAARLQRLRMTGLLDTPAEERFDRLTRMACAELRIDIALVSLVDAHRQWFKSRCGLDTAETARSVSFCGHTILEDGAMVVPDTFLDLRFRDNPLVTGAPFIRFYAGFPIEVLTYPIGTFCVIGRTPRPVPVPRRDLLLLHDLAREVARAVSADLAWGKRNLPT